MSAKTKIVVLHMKEVIYASIFAVLGILLILLLIMMFSSDNKPYPSDSTTNAKLTDVDTTCISNQCYIPGIYTTELILGGQAIEVEVILSKDAISSIRLVNLSESITTMYPLLQPTFNDICDQVFLTQSLENIHYTDNSKYTSLVLLEAIKNCLDKANSLKSNGSSYPEEPFHSTTLLVDIILVNHTC